MRHRYEGKGPRRAAANALLFVTVIFMSAVGPAIAGHAADASRNVASGDDFAYPA